MKFILGLLLLSLACKKPAPEVAEGKFSVPPLAYSEHSYNRQFDFLIKRVHEQTWHIAYGFSSADCKASLPIATLQSAVDAALRLWLAPLKKMTVQSLVNQYTYHERAVRASGFARSPLRLVVGKLKPHLKIIFYCRPMINHAMPIPVHTRRGEYLASDLIPSVHLARHEKRRDYIVGTPFSGTVLVHELGHAFGFLDTYPSEHHSNVAQPASIMSSQAFYNKSGANVLAVDDIKGIKWLYKYYHQDHEKISSTNKCFFPDYELVEHKRGSPACLPKYPLITSLKMAYQHERQQNLYATDKHLHNAVRTLGYTHGDPGKANAQDEDGNTALHHAVTYAIASKKMYQIVTTSAWLLDMPSKWAKVGTALLALQPCSASGTARRGIDLACFDSQELNCKCIDLTIKNKKQQTARDLADDEIAAAFP